MWVRWEAIFATVALRPDSRKDSSPVASNWRSADPYWKPCVHSVQPRAVYVPAAVKTGEPWLASYVSSMHLSFLSPLPPGIPGICKRFSKVMTVEINYGDEPDAPGITPENRRRGQLAFLLRGQLLIDADSWGRTPGEPLRPGQILEAIEAKLASSASGAKGGAQ